MEGKALSDNEIELIFRKVRGGEQWLASPVYLDLLGSALRCLSGSIEHAV